MKISDLYAPHGPFVGQDFYIIGSGSSMSVLPREFLRDKLCVVLNDGCRYFSDLGPIAFANNKLHFKFIGERYTTKIVKARLKYDPNPERDDNHVPWDSPEFYCFSYKEPPWEPLSHHDERTLWADPLYFWAPSKGSVSAFACQFALYAGARAIYLVGCDCTAINGEHYTTGKKNHQSIHDYSQYAYGLERMQREAHKRGVPMLSLTPFFGLGFHERQFKDMTRWLNR